MGCFVLPGVGESREGSRREGLRVCAGGAQRAARSPESGMLLLPPGQLWLQRFSACVVGDICWSRVK